MSMLCIASLIPTAPTRPGTVLCCTEFGGSWAFAWSIARGSQSFSGAANDRRFLSCPKRTSFGSKKVTFPKNDSCWWHEVFVVAQMEYGNSWKKTSLRSNIIQTKKNIYGNWLFSWFQTCHRGGTGKSPLDLKIQFSIVFHWLVFRHMSHEKNLGWLWYIGNPTQLYRDYNKPL